MCGICAIWGENKSQTLPLLLESLKNLQHRGQESFGYSYLNQEQIVTRQHQGIVRNYNLDSEELDLKSNLAIGHLRYSTSGSKSSDSSQPITGKEFVLVHNGNIPNKLLFLEKITQDLSDYDYSDTQLLSFYLEQEMEKESKWENIFQKLLYDVPGVYCLIIMTPKYLWVIRDHTGIRPLIIARSPPNQDKQIIVGSESVILDSRHFYDFQFQDLQPGSIARIDSKTGQIKTFLGREANPTPCLFEFIYFLNPKSIVSGQSVLKFRQESGKILGLNESIKWKNYFQEESKNNNLIVIGAPSTGLPTAEAYAKTLGLNYRLDVLTKKSAQERTFILSTNKARRKAVKEKYNYLEAEIKDRIVVIIDDSLVRGNTLSIINQKLRDYGAKEIHVRISSPKVYYPCLYGIDISTKEELIANKSDFNHQMVNADSLEYLSLDDMKKINPKLKYYQGCFDGNYLI